ncbi:MAG: 4-hydroxy-tetrahydrodipicolinate reductase [Deferribacteraceae bacterium]|nr:4-hydroxy-tetrahydrodipicolinate reductase [Deferribacteraceae bacterium]
MNNQPVNICVIGASGRMGIEIIRAVAADPGTILSGAVERFNSKEIGSSALELAKCGAGGCVITSELELVAGSSDVIIDFSGAEGTFENIKSYWSAGKPLVVGSTGLRDIQMEKLIKLKKYIPLLISSNMSIGVNIMAKLTELAAKALGNDFDIEIFEAHHRHKKDAPSGTALALARAAAKGRCLTEESFTFSRHGFTGERKSDTIGFQVMRGGGIAGDHTVFFCSDDERLEITHKASSRSIFAKGALKAAKWLAKKPNGLYSLNDVLELK